MTMIERGAKKASVGVEGIAIEDGMFLQCICEMLENVEKKAKMSNCATELSQLNDHRRVIRRVLEQNLALS